MSVSQIESTKATPVTVISDHTPTQVLQSFAEWPAFQLGKSRFDLHTYGGRVRHFFDIIDPRTLFTSEEELQRCRKLVHDFKDGTLPPGITDRELWQAQKVVQAIIHPDTGEKIPMPFRMSGYVPFGSPIVAALLQPNPSLASIIFWQWINQSHNACVNYCNRNATRPTPFNKFIEGYLGAVTTAVTIAVALNRLVKKAESLPPSTRAVIQKFVPYPAIAFANICNVYLMRRQELTTGIEVHDQSHNVIGISKAAAANAIKDTAITRVVLPAPIFILPPMIMTALEKTVLFKRFPRSYLPINATLGTLAFGLALPLAIGLFPQESKIHRSKLEKELQERTPEEYLYFNKGL